jgi:uncharacterized damage-inducible protein DinB
MNIDVSTIETYFRHAFAGMSRVLDRLDDATVNRKPTPWGTNTVAGLIVHCCELSPSWFELPGLGRDSTRNRDAEFTTTATVDELRQRIATSEARTLQLLREFAAGPTATDHPMRAFLPGDDQTDGGLVIHVLEELFQHLGHMEVTADALAYSPG